MTQSILEISFSNPGDGNQLGPEQRRNLRARLKEAHSSGAAVVLIRVAENAWDQDPVLDPSGISARHVSEEFHAAVVELFALDVPVVVYLDGRVTGFGLALALACDVRFATPEASFGIGAPETPNALISGTSWLLADRAGSALVSHLSWTGRLITAEEARQLQLLSGISPDDREARDLAARLAALPKGATSALKRSTNGRLRADLSAQLDYDSWLATVSAGA